MVPYVCIECGRTYAELPDLAVCVACGVRVMDRGHSTSSLLAVLSAAEKRRERQVHNRWRGLGALAGGLLGVLVVGLWPVAARYGAFLPLALAILGVVGGALVARSRVGARLAAVVGTSEARPPRRWPLAAALGALLLGLAVWFLTSMG